VRLKCRLTGRRITIGRAQATIGAVSSVEPASWCCFNGIARAHQALDAAVAQAYGWPANLSDEEILSRLLTLNLERSVPAEAKKTKVTKAAKVKLKSPAKAAIAAE
jgi:hypothetical protein